MKKAVAIHDICGFGKCSLTLALPILSAAGIETSVLPTALLSSHTGGLGAPFCLDLTNEMKNIIAHWEKLDLKFDAVYCGYLSSPEQADIVADFIDCFKAEGGIALVDPAMADGGKLYGGINEDMPQKMKQLCHKADIITPNVTEAMLLLGEKIDKKISFEEAKIAAAQLSEMMDADVVITGLEKGDEIGALAHTQSGEEFTSYFPKIDGKFHGTGDVFASALVAKLACQCPLRGALNAAGEFTHKVIENTAKHKSDERFGLKFEELLCLLAE